MAKFFAMDRLLDAVEVVYLFNKTDMLTAALPVVRLCFYDTRHIFMDKHLRLCSRNHYARCSRSKGYVLHWHGDTSSSSKALYPIKQSVSRYRLIQLRLCEQ